MSNDAVSKRMKELEAEETGLVEDQEQIKTQMATLQQALARVNTRRLQIAAAHGELKALFGPESSDENQEVAVGEETN